MQEKIRSVIPFWNLADGKLHENGNCGSKYFESSTYISECFDQKCKQQWSVLDLCLLRRREMILGSSERKWGDISFLYWKLENEGTIWCSLNNMETEHIRSKFQHTLQEEISRALLILNVWIFNL
jgi:hypothetical protein